MDVKSLQERVAALEQRVEQLERQISHSREGGNPVDGSPPAPG
jgi:hypothetical protein